MSESIDDLLDTLASIASSRDLALLQNLKREATKFGQYAATVREHAANRIEELERVPVGVKPYVPSTAAWNHGKPHPIGQYTVEYQVPRGVNWMLTVKK